MTHMGMHSRRCLDEESHRTRVERTGTHKESAAQDKQWSGAQAGLTAKAVKLKVLLRRNTKYRKSCKLLANGNKLLING